MNTTENNKIIAEFLGATNNNHPDDYEMFGIISNIEDGENEKHYFKSEEMLFNSDWNWLMEVVVKCKESQTFGSQNLITDIDNALIETTIENIYCRCIDFIKWYNQQKN